MKTKLIFLLTIIFSTAYVGLKGQTCVKCDGNSSNTGDFATSLGQNTTASGHASFASGSFSEALKDFSTAIGARNTSDGIYTTTLGNNLKATVSHAMAIGDGYGTNYELVNDRGYSLMIGFRSTLPTLYISMSPDKYKTGRIAIGNVNLAQPLAKLHIRADDGEVAAVLIEPNSWAGNAQAHLFIGNKFNGITASRDSGLIFWSQRNYVFGNDGFVGINTFSPQYNLHVNGSTFTEGFRLYDDKLPPKQGFVLVSADELGNAFWTDPNDFSLWKPHENGEDIYRLTGNVGIGIIETGDYRLAVLGKIHATEVMVEHQDDWPDYVLKDGYILPGLDEVETFIKENNHLPDIPSETEVKENGIALGEMNGLLLKKIEELTLYTIEQQKLIVEQQKRMEKMESRLIELEK